MHEKLINRVDSSVWYRKGNDYADWVPAILTSQVAYWNFVPSNFF